MRIGLRTLARRVRSLVPERPVRRIEIDEPAGDITLPCASVHVRGWVVVDGMLPVGVRVGFEGRETVMATLGEIRPDVGAHLGAAGPAAFGWSVDLPIRNQPPGIARLDVEALDSHGRILATNSRECALQVDPGHAEPLGMLDAPVDGDEVDGRVVVVSGWVLFPRGRTASIRVELDGETVANARTFTSRADAGASFEDMDAPVAGFEHVLALPELPQDGRAFAISVIATALDGRTWHSPASVVGASPLVIEDQDRAELLRARTASLVGLRPPHRAVDTLVFTHSLSLGGGQLWLSELLTQIHSRQGASCELVAVGDGALREVFEDAGIPVHVSRGTPVANVDEYEGQVRELALLIAASGCGSVLVNTLGLYAAVEAAVLAGKPVVWAIHESFHPEEFLYLNYGGGAHPYVRARLTAALGQADRLVFEASQTSELFAEHASAERRVVVDYGIDTAGIDRFRAAFDRDEARRELGIATTDNVLLVMGVYEARKAQAMVVAAFDELAAVHPDLRLVLVGAHDSPYLDTLKTQVQRSRHRARISLVPITPEIERWYAIADLFLCASDVESLPRSVMEAMAFGVPVVSTDVFGLADLITDGETGWLMPARDAGALVSTLHRVLRLDRHARDAVATRAHAMVIEGRDSCHYAQAFSDMLTTLAGERGGTAVASTRQASDDGGS